MTQDAPEDYNNPHWDDRDRVHNWHNYISNELRFMWETFTDQQKRAIADNAERLASHEEWD